jgi:hypothetical protein
MATAAKGQTLTIPTDIEKKILMAELQTAGVPTRKWNPNMFDALHKEVVSQRSTLVYIHRGSLRRDTDVVAVIVECNGHRLSHKGFGGSSFSRIIPTVKGDSFDLIARECMRDFKITSLSSCNYRRTYLDLLIENSPFLGLPTQASKHIYAVNLWQDDYRPEGYRYGREHLVWQKIA